MGMEELYGPRVDDIANQMANVGKPKRQFPLPEGDVNQISNDIGAVGGQPPMDGGFQMPKSIDQISQEIAAVGHPHHKHRSMTNYASLYGDKR